MFGPLRLLLAGLSVAYFTGAMLEEKMSGASRQSMPAPAALTPTARMAVNVVVSFGCDQAGPMSSTSNS